MGDERLRELERQFRASADPADGAALLTERRRRGELSPDRLLFAAFVGEPAARAALGSEAPASDGLALFARFQDRERAWAPFDKESCIRVAIAIAREAATVLEDAGEEATSARFEARVMLAVAEGWVRRPDRAHKIAATKVSLRADRLWQTHFDPQGMAVWWHAVLCAGEVARAAGLATGNARISLRPVSQHAACALSGRPEAARLLDPDEVDALVTPALLQRFVAAMRREVAPWALGISDPLVALEWKPPPPRRRAPRKRS